MRRGESEVLYSVGEGRNEKQAMVVSQRGHSSGGVSDVLCRVESKEERGRRREEEGGRKKNEKFNSDAAEADV